MLRALRRVQTEVSSQQGPLWVQPGRSFAVLCRFSFLLHFPSESLPLLYTILCVPASAQVLAPASAQVCKRRGFRRRCGRRGDGYPHSGGLALEIRPWGPITLSKPRHANH